MSKYIRLYQTLSGATSDETIVSPNLTFCVENLQTVHLGYGITKNTPLKIMAKDNVIEIKEKNKNK